jgi:hypothetical protein
VGSIAGRLEQERSDYATNSSAVHCYRESTDKAQFGRSAMHVEVSIGEIASAAYITSLIGLAYEYVTAPTRED